jgi:Bacterial PH domain
VFRNSPLAVLAAIAFMVCFTPVALTVPGMTVLYLIPVAMVVWVLRVRTTVDADTIAARGTLRTQRVAWSDVTALRLRTRSRISAVLSSGTELPLPAVHVRDLPVLAMMSGGRLPDPSAEAGAPERTQPERTEPEPEPTAPEPAAPATPASPEE